MAEPWEAERWALLRIKREWVPEWLWRRLCRIKVGESQWLVRPWPRRAFTRSLTADEAVRWWSANDG